MLTPAMPDTARERLRKAAQQIGAQGRRFAEDHQPEANASGAQLQQCISVESQIPAERRLRRRHLRSAVVNPLSDGGRRTSGPARRSRRSRSGCP